MPRSNNNPADRNVATMIALFGLLFVIGALLVLVGMVVFPAVTKVILVIAILIGIGVLQYVTWGWKLDRDRIDGDEDESQRHS